MGAGLRLAGGVVSVRRRRPYELAAPAVCGLCQEWQLTCWGADGALLYREHPAAYGPSGPPSVAVLPAWCPNTFSAVPGAAPLDDRRTPTFPRHWPARSADTALPGPELNEPLQCPICTLPRPVGAGPSSSGVVLCECGWFFTLAPLDPLDEGS